MSEQDCLFCKILAGTAAADVVHQDPRCVVVRDTNPQAPTHLLV
ncbi:MAG: HIT domain-containing protein, partial [Pyrinomonadaceae bacterium]